MNAAATKFKATLNPPYDRSKPELVYRFYGDGNLIYTSPIFAASTAKQAVEINVTGYTQLKIEVELVDSDPYYDNGFTNIDTDYLGIENATITTTDY